MQPCYATLFNVCIYAVSGMVFIYMYYNAITLCCRCTDEAQKAENTSILVSTAIIMYFISYRIYFYYNNVIYIHRKYYQILYYIILYYKIASAVL